MFLIFIFIIFLYFLFYLRIEKLTNKNLLTLQNELNKDNIVLTWQNIEKSGFPYRIVNRLNSVKININNIEIFFKNLDVIYQPWNINHILFKTSEKIKIVY